MERYKSVSLHFFFDRFLQQIFNIYNLENYKYFSKFALDIMN